MKKILKNLYGFSVNILRSIVSLLSVVIFSRHSKYNLSYYKKKNSETKIIIMGNGPTLGECINNDVGHFKESVLMAVNSFYDSDLLISLKPQYYILCDPAFFREDVPYGSAEHISRFLDFMNTVDWDIFVLVPYEFKKGFTYHQIQNDKVHFVFFNRTPINGFSFINHFLYKSNAGMPTPMNILNAAIFSAINLGFKEIELYGADHSWLKDVRVNKKNETCMREGHFYDNEDKLRVVNGYDITKLMDHFACAFNSHKLLQKYAICQGACILNCTPGSFIDAYPRKEGC